MEKMIAILWDTDNETALRELPQALAEAGARHIRLNLEDEVVAPATGLKQLWQAPQHAVTVQFWLPSTNPIFRSEVDSILAAHCTRFAAWLVAESTIKPNVAHPPKPGKRTEGFAQLAFLSLPEGMDWKDWRAVWRDYHTRVAIDTQANFEYVHNLIVEPLTDDAPPYVAIVEECFPAAAMTDPYAFFDAVGDAAKFEANLATMMESCNRFITPGTIDVIPTSQYDFG